jgi:hypothetical protein
VTEDIGAMSDVLQLSATLRSAVSACAERAGGVASYASGNEVLTLFPALSTQVPPMLVPVVDGPAYVTGGEHEAMPEKDWPPNPTVTGWSYHPPESGGRALAVIVGEETSTWRGTERLVDVPSVQVTPHETVLIRSTAYSVAMLNAHPEVLVAGALPCHTTVTGAPYQPALHAAVAPPDVQVAVIVPCAAAVELAASGTPSAASATASAIHRLMPTTHRSDASLVGAASSSRLPVARAKGS